MTKLTLGFSPCPNDTFIFDALIHHKIDTEGLQFDVFYDDVETLNQKAMRGELDITKLSYHAFAYVADKYVLLDAGSALGFGVGPLLISNFEISISDLENGQIVNRKSQPVNPIIGIPGKYTTANFLLGLAFPNATNKVELVFSDIENAVLDGRVDAGLIIHENRFTYQDKGLKKIIDLGDYWEQQTGCPIPLGGIVANRNLPSGVQHRVNRVLRRSVEFAFENPKSGLDFIRSHAQEMSEEVMYKHIDLYVNKYSVDLGAEGKKAIKLLFDTALEKNIIPEIREEIFLNRNQYKISEINTKSVKSITDFSEGQLLLVDKPYKWTSFDVVGKLRNAFKPLKLKVGHAGTLDPLATGLLIICTGKMTKQIDTFQAQEKEYTGTMILGASTPSYDMETEVDQKFDITQITDEQIKAACEQFIGDIQQYPPAHSAIKIDGERLYEKARRGEEVEKRLRPVTITEFEITGIALPEVNFRVVCSKGTYIRSLIHDFGKVLNNGAYLSRLRRTRSGNCRIEDAFEVMELVNIIRELKMITPISEV